MILFSLIFPKRCKKLFKYPYIYTIKTVQPHIPFFMTDRPTFFTGILRTGLYCLTAMLSAVILSCSGPDKPEYLIGVSQCSDDSWRRQMNEEIRIEALFYPGTEVEVLSADDDNEKQIRDILYFIDKKVDILIVAPNASGAVTPAVETAYDRGIPVILVDRIIDSDKYTAFVGADNYSIGTQVGQYLRSRVQGGKIAELTGDRRSSPAQERSSGFRKGLGNAGPVLAASVDALWSEERAAFLMDSLLVRHPDIKAVFAHNDRMAASAERVAASKGRDDILFIGIDAMPGPGNGIELVADGTLNASFVYPTGGDRLLQTAMKIAAGEAFDRKTVLETALVDESNALVMQLQSAKVSDLDEKITVLQKKVNEYLTVTRLQKMLLTTCFIIVVLLSVLLAITAVTLRHNRRTSAELSAMNRKLEEATNAKLSFFTNVSHDFRTPLTLVADPVNQLIKSPGLSDRERFLVNIAHKNVTILLRLVNQILDFRKFESGKLSLVLSRFRLDLALADWMSAFDSLAKVRHVDFGLEIVGDDGTRQDDYTVTADREKVERIVYNILSNAFKFTKDTGEGYVHMRLSHAGRDNVEISITDNGEGISAEHINNIFDSFYQADVHHSGSGIGLVLSKAFAELHGGSITVKSAEGRGSVFTVVLPVMQEDPVMPGMAEPGSEMWKFRDGAVYDASQETISTSLFSDEDISESKKTVLIIDDNRDVREYLKSVLSFEYNIIEASSGEEGLRQAGKRVPDAIICDVMMPGMDGMECCRRLKSDIRTSHIPVLMLTAYAAEEQKIKGYECGADSYISKPFSSDLLQARLANLIEGRKMLLSVFGDPCSVTGHSVPDVDKNFIDRFRAIINSRIADPSLTVESIGEEIGLSRVQLYRKTKALIGYSPNEFLRICRLRKAAAMLSSTDRSVSEVAYGVGFSSPSYFTRCYREYFGENPVSARNSPVSPVSGNINSPVLR